MLQKHGLVLIFMLQAEMATNGKLQLGYRTLDLYKGFTKATVIAFVLCTCVHADLDQDWPKLEPLQKVLDKCFLIPMHAPRQHNTEGEGGGARLPCNIFNSGLRHGPYIRTDGPGCVSQD